MNRFEQATLFGEAAGRLAFEKMADAYADARATELNPILSNVLGYGAVGGLGGAAVGGLASLAGLTRKSDKDNRGALRRALSDAAHLGLVGAGAGGLLGGGTAALQMYRPYAQLKHLLKTRINAANDVVGPTVKELLNNDGILVGSPAMLDEVPHTRGLLNTRKMHDHVNNSLNMAGDGTLSRDLKDGMDKVLKFLGLAAAKDKVNDSINPVGQ